MLKLREEKQKNINRVFRTCEWKTFSNWVQLNFFFFSFNLTSIYLFNFFFFFTSYFGFVVDLSSNGVWHCTLPFQIHYYCCAMVWFEQWVCWKSLVGHGTARWNEWAIYTGFSFDYLIRLFRCSFSSSSSSSLSTLMTLMTLICDPWKLCLIFFFFSVASNTFQFHSEYALHSVFLDVNTSRIL